MLKPGKRPLDKHQRRAIHFITRHNGQAGVFMDGGTGKTLTAIRYTEHGYFPALIICRRDDFLTWETELLEEGYTSDDWFKIDKTKVKLPKTPPLWTMVTYDRVKRPDVFKWIKSVQWGIVTGDEGHMIKRWKTQRTKKVYYATRHIPRRLLLTATPINNTLLDIFAEAKFIDNGKTFGLSEWKFLLKFFMKAGDFPKWFLKRGSKERIEKLMDKMSFAVRADDVLKLPPKRSIVKGTPPTAAQKRYQKEILEEWELTLQDETVDIDQVIVQLIKLRQVASGFLYNTELVYDKVKKCQIRKKAKDGSFTRINNNKIKLLSKLFKEDEYLGLKSKVVIWCAHRAEITMIGEMLSKAGISYVEFYGTRPKENRAARTTFLKNPKCRVFLGQSDKGVGINELVVADSAVYYSNSLRVISRVQSKLRIRRRGSDRHDMITYYDLATENSIDVDILKSLNKNINIAESVLFQLRQKTKLGNIFESF